jgi:hypothetical protein
VETVRAFVLRQYAYFAGTQTDRRLAEYAGRSRFPGGAKRERRKAEMHERLSAGALYASFVFSALLVAYGLSAWLAPEPLRGFADEESLHGALIVARASGGRTIRVDRRQCGDGRRDLPPLDGIALAIELAAARIKLLSPAQLAEKLSALQDALAV